MNRIFAVIMAVALLVSLNAGADTLISGTWRKGSNITEPKPQKSKNMETIVGGFGVRKDGAAYVLQVRMHQPFKRPMRIKAEFQNPEGEPFVEEGEIPANHRSLNLVHGPVKGLKIHRSYWVKISIFEREDFEKPVDVLEQNIKSYVDTTGEAILVKPGLEDMPQDKGAR
ncbi:MAG: hypothetical protein JNN05_02075 [Candidatus Omnitrophica bacterium]|nr:hypothetical protein [Candidatus Omnitrophota bacterium]